VCAGVQVEFYAGNVVFEVIGFIGLLDFGGGSVEQTRNVAAVHVSTRLLAHERIDFHHGADVVGHLVFAFLGHHALIQVGCAEGPRVVQPGLAHIQVCGLSQRVHLLRGMIETLFPKCNRVVFIGH